MLIRALTSNPELLILDEPFEGLDVNSLAALQEHLTEISAEIPIILVLNRIDQCPQFISHVAYMEQGELAHQVAREDSAAYDQLMQLLHLKQDDLTVPPADPQSTLPELDRSQPLVRLTNAQIKYTDTIIFDQLGLDH